MVLGMLFKQMLYRKDRVPGSPGETLPCALMAPGACKIRHGCNVPQVPVQIIPLGVSKLYQSGGVIPSVADQNCEGRSPDHPLE